MVKYENRGIRPYRSIMYRIMQKRQRLYSNNGNTFEWLYDSFNSSKTIGELNLSATEIKTFTNMCCAFCTLNRFFFVFALRSLMYGCHVWRSVSKETKRALFPYMTTKIDRMSRWVARKKFWPSLVYARLHSTMYIMSC